MLRYFFYLTFIACVFSSCVPNKKFLFLQKDDIHKKDMKRDSVVRTYSVNKFEYRIQPQDIISVRFQSITDENYDFLAKGNQQVGAVGAGGALLLGELVDENGEINFPVIGKVKVSGLTVFEIQDKLKVIAEQYLESPNVKVRLLNFRVTLVGEVAKEGTVTMTNNRVTMLEAIALSGGLGEVADRSRVKLIRQYGDSLSVQYINLLDENFINSPYYYAHQNDVLVVPPLRQRAFRKYFAGNLGLVLSSLSLVILILNFSAR